MRLDARRAHRRYLILLGMRWLPIGLTIPVIALLPLARGLTLPQLGLVAAAQGLLVFVLELPTGGLSDSLGRRPVLLASGVVGAVAMGLLFVADSVAMFLVVYALKGVYRALDSGPLEAWYVDAVHADQPDADLSRGLSAGGVVVGVAIGAGALAGGGVVALAPLPGVEPLATPVLAALAVQIAGLVTMAALLTEVRAARGARAVLASVRDVPRVIGSGIRLARGSRVLIALLSVELFWGLGVVGYETLTPVRLAEVMSDADAAAALMGPAASAAWLASAAGAALVTLVSRRIGVAWTAAATRILQGATVVALGLMAGPAGIVAAFLGTYVIHGAANPMHMTLLHRQVDGSHRTTVVSMNSMLSQAAGAIGLVALTALAGATTTGVAMVVGGVALAAAAPLYLPARTPRRVPADQWSS